MNEESELRIYIAVRADLGLGRLDLAAQAARATWFALRSAAGRGDASFASYDADLQPKIGVRAKTEGVLERAEREARLAGLSTGVARLPDGTPAAVGIGPVCRAALPAFVAKLQLLGDAGPEAAAPARCDLPGEAVWLFVREDAEIPYGKLAAQAGHGLWGAVAPVLEGAAVQAWHAAGAPVVVREVPDLQAMERVFGDARAAGLPSSFVIDAGRTVFGKPTPTVVGIGPCAMDCLPENALSLLAPGARQDVPRRP